MTNPPISTPAPTKPDVLGGAFDIVMKADANNDGILSSGEQRNLYSKLNQTVSNIKPGDSLLGSPVEGEMIDAVTTVRGSLGSVTKLANANDIQYGAAVVGAIAPMFMGMAALYAPEAAPMQPVRFDRLSLADAQALNKEFDATSTRYLSDVDAAAKRRDVIPVSANAAAQPGLLATTAYDAIFNGRKPEERLKQRAQIGAVLKMADTNNDNRVTGAEMVSFAEGLANAPRANAPLAQAPAANDGLPATLSEANDGFTGSAITYAAAAPLKMLNANDLIAISSLASKEPLMLADGKLLQVDALSAKEAAAINVSFNMIGDKAIQSLKVVAQQRDAKVNPDAPYDANPLLPAATPVVPNAPATGRTATI